jgi:hypothetical protein
MALVQRQEQGLLAVEVQIRGALGHPGLRGHVSHGGGVIAGPGKARQSGGDDLAAPRAPPQRSSAPAPPPDATPASGRPAAARACRLAASSQAIPAGGHKISTAHSRHRSGPAFRYSPELAGSRVSALWRSG